MDWSAVGFLAVGLLLSCLWPTHWSSSSCVLDVCSERKRVVGVSVYKFLIMCLIFMMFNVSMALKGTFHVCFDFFFFPGRGVARPRLGSSDYLWLTRWSSSSMGYVCSKRKRAVGVIVLSLMKWLFCAWCDFPLTVVPLMCVYLLKCLSFITWNHQKCVFRIAYS